MLDLFDNYDGPQMVFLTAFQIYGIALGPFHPFARKSVPSVHGGRCLKFLEYVFPRLLASAANHVGTRKNQIHRFLLSDTLLWVELWLLCKGEIT